VYLETYMAAKRQTLRRSSFERESGLIRRFIIPRIGHLALKEITPAHVERFYMELEHDGVSEHSRHQVHLALTNALGRAARQKKIGSNPASREVLSFVPVYKRPQVTAMGDEEITRHIDAAKRYAEDPNHTYGALFLVALYTGLRRGELLALKWRDVDWHARTISVNATQTVVTGKLDEDNPKSRAGRRTVSIDGDGDTTCIDALKAHRAAQLERRMRCSDWDDHDLVFPSDQGTPIYPSNMYKAFYKFLKDAGIDKVKFHSTRHTNITAAMRAGVNPKAVQVHAGHADFSMTAAYAHVTVRDEHQVAGAVAAAFARKRRAV
jgi:integrase